MLHEHKINDGNRVVIDLLQIVHAIREAEPEVIIEPFGDPQVLVIVADTPRKPALSRYFVTWLLLFFGSGLAIMNFHTDVSMKDVHIRITELVTGKRTEHPLMVSNSLFPWHWSWHAGVLQSSVPQTVQRGAESA